MPLRIPFSFAISLLSALMAPLRRSRLKDHGRDTGDHARESGCTELALDVHVDNERAVAFYVRLGFEPYRRRMLLGVDEFE